MINYTLYTIISKGIPSGVGVHFENDEYRIIDLFFGSDEIMFTDEIKAYLKSPTERKLSFSGNIYSITFLKDEVIIEDTLNYENNLNCTININYFKRIYNDWKKAESFLKKEKSNTRIIPTSVVVQNVQNNILGGKKVPHSISQPVLHFEKGQYYLAVFVFFFDRNDIKKQEIKRPSRWALLDIRTGEIVENRTCSEYDFSNESFENSYSIMPDAEYDLSKKYLLSTWGLLDSVRYELIARENVNTVIYYDYLTRVLNNIPREYQIFYKELSIGFRREISDENRTELKK